MIIKTPQCYVLCPLISQSKPCKYDPQSHSKLLPFCIDEDCKYLHQLTTLSRIHSETVLFDSCT